MTSSPLGGWATIASLRVVRLNQGHQPRPRNHLSHLSKKLRSPGNFVVLLEACYRTKRLLFRGSSHSIRIASMPNAQNHKTVDLIRDYLG